MPLYEYECTKCHKRTEKIESTSGPHLKKCPHCGGRVERLLAAPAIQFKGSGWYVTDYAGKKAASGESGAGKEGSSAEGASKDSATETAKESTKESSHKEAKEKKSAKK